MATDTPTKPPKPDKVKVIRRLPQPIDKHGREMSRHPKQDKPMLQFWEEVSADEVRQILDDTGLVRYRGFARDLADPTLSKKSISVLCRKHHISLQELTELWRKHNLAVGISRAARRMPNVIDGIAFSAEPKMTFCDRCDGLGIVPHSVEGKDHQVIEDTRPCPKCEGTAQIWVGGNEGAQKLISQIMGLTGASAVNVNTQVNVNLDSGGFEEAVSEAQKLVQGVVDVAVEADPDEKED